MFFEPITAIQMINPIHPLSALQGHKDVQILLMGDGNKEMEIQRGVKTEPAQDQILGAMSHTQAPPQPLILAPPLPVLDNWDK